MALPTLPSTRTALANRILRFLGDGTVIADLDDATDTSKATQAILAHFDTTYADLLREYPWSFAMRLKELVLLTQNPNDNWLYSYRKPPEAANLWSFDPELRIQDNENTPPRMLSSQGTGSAVNVSAVTRDEECQVTAAAHGLVDGDLVAFAALGGMTQLNGNTYIASDCETNTFKIKSLTTGEYVDSTDYTTYTSGGTATRQPCEMIQTDLVDADVWITDMNIDIILWPVDFINAFCWAVAAMAGPLIVGQDRPDMVVMAQHNAANAVAKAFSNNQIEQRRDQPPISKYAKARRGC